MFTEKDLAQFEKKGISLAQVEEQIEKFKKGFKYAELASAARLSDGIVRFEDTEVNELIEYYNEKSGAYKIVKFVPASGAASRMFKNLFAFKDDLQSDDFDLEKCFEDQSFNSPYYFIQNIQKFAFYQDLSSVLSEQGMQIEDLLAEKNYLTVISALLDESGLNYGKLPKALLRFHSYTDGARYAIEEHLVEGVNYAADKDANVYLHFTVSPEHINLFESTLSSLVPDYEQKHEVKFVIDYSIQKPETDTLAVDMDNKPFREEDGEILFRPGGHGALIQNMNDLQYDIAFVKNIDNIVPDHLRDTTYQYKKVIGGHLIKLVEEVNKSLEILSSGEYDDFWVDQVLTPFIQNKLMIHLPDQFGDFAIQKKAEFIANKLNRPIRICGMVKNEGEPGGGPFMVNSYGELSLQIVEKSQINEDDVKQTEILSNATHFNPVDLVCSLKDYQGNAFDLLNYVDDETAFISEKSKNGKKLKALELPGLWNGAMADWITVFVEIPIITFNPVKVVNDLLRDTHQ
jgi:hypothetical protein